MEDSVLKNDTLPVSQYFVFKAGENDEPDNIDYHDIKFWILPKFSIQ